MEMPQSITNAIKDAATRHTSDIEAAVTLAERRIRKLDEFSEWEDELIREAIRERVYDVRHKHNTALKREMGAYGGPAKTTSGASAAVQKAAQSVYNLRIAGTLLGLLRGDELAAVAETERAIGQGHLFNATLCEQLIRHVPDNKTVQEAVSEAKLRRMCKQVEKKMAA